MRIPVVPVTLVTALLVAVPSFETSIHAQNPITAAREAFRRAQEEAKRKAQEEAQRRAGQATGQPAGGQSSPASAAPTGATSVVQSGAAPRAAGTAETTAKYAQAAMFIDVAGLKLGMPLKDALPVLKSLNLRPMREPQVEIVWPLDSSGVEKNPPPNAPRSIYLLEYIATDNQGSISESVQLSGAKHPNPAVITQIERKVTYRSGQGPLRDTVLTSLRQKYGPESLVVSEIPTNLVLRWYFDDQRQALQGNLAKQQSICGGGAGGGVADNAGLCPSLTVLDVLLMHTAPGVVTELMVRAVSRPLNKSAEEATQTFLRQMDEARREQQRIESTKRAAPKL
jgi:hypothetical protein